MVASGCQVVLVAGVITLLAVTQAVPADVAAAPASATPPAADCSLQLVGHGTNNKFGVLAASLNCTSKSGVPVTVGINKRFMRQHAGSFSGVQVVPSAQLPCQQQSTNVMALLYFCGNYSMSFTDLSVTDVWLPPSSVIFNTILLFGQGVQANVSNSNITDNHNVICVHLKNTAQLVLQHVLIAGNYGRQSVAARVEDKAQLIAINSTFERNTASENAGAISSHNTASVILIKCNASRNTAAVSGGGMYAVNNSNIALNNSVLADNTAGKDSGAVYLTATMYLLHSKIINNTVITLKGYDTVQGEGGAVTMDKGGELYVLNGSFIAYNSAYYGGAIYAWANCKIVIDNSTVAGNKGKFGGFAFTRGTVKLTVHNNSTFVSNSAFGGGCINVFAASTAHISNSTFLLNSAMYGGVAYIEGTGCSVNMTSGNFMNNTASSGGGACYASMLGTLQVGGDIHNAAVFSNNSAEQGGAFYARDKSLITLLDGTELFSNNATKDGGGIYAQDDAGIIVRAGSKLSRNVAAYGGGICLHDSSNAIVGGLLIDNKAHKDGGGLMISGNASLVVEDGAHFSGNSAGGMGGAMFLGTELFSPSAVQHAIASNNQASFSPEFAVSTTNFTLLTDHNITDFVSGLGAAEGILSASLNVTGHFGFPSAGVLVQAVLLYNATNDLAFLGSNRSTPDGIAYLNVKVRQPPGVYTVRYSLVSEYDSDIMPANVVLHVRPCERGEVAPVPDACERCPQDTYSLQPAATSCSSCPPGANCTGGFSIVPMEGWWHSAAASIQVHRCPNQAACYGNRTAVQECSSTRVPQATSPCATSIGYADLQCSTGYHGHLCGLCAEGYGTTKPFTCARCLPRSTILGLYMLAAICMLALMKVLCFFTISEASDDHLNHPQESSSLAEPPGLTSRVQGVNNTGSAMTLHNSSTSIQPSELLKPLVLFSQYLLIISSLDIEWPSLLLYPFKALAWAWASSSPETLNIECLLKKGATMPIAAQKVLFYLLLPVVMLAAILLLDAITIQARKSIGRRASVVHVRNRLVPTTIIVFFFFFPSICRTTFSLFACVTIDQPASHPFEARAVGSFWVLDVNQQCLQGYHRYFAYALGIPLVMLCCLVIPAAIVLLMLHHKHRLTDQHFMQYYGFLFRSYRPKCCWWEALVTIQTVVLVAISVFGYSMGPHTTALCMNGALAVTGLLLAFVKPYTQRSVGHVSLQCIGCLLLTTYYALTLIQVDTHSPGQDYGAAMGSVVLLVNVVFVLSILWKLLKVIDWRGFWGKFRGICEKLIAGAAGLARNVSREWSSHTLKDSGVSVA